MCSEGTLNKCPELELLCLFSELPLLKYSKSLRKPLFKGNGTYSSDIIDDISHVI
jgi:hypothetical protein